MLPRDFVISLGSEGGLAKDHTFSLLCLFGICNSVTRPTNMSYSDHIRHPPVLLGLCPLYLLLPCPRRRCQMCLWTLGLLCHLLLGSGCICQGITFEIHETSIWALAGVLFQILGLSVTTCICIFNVSAFLQICIIRQSFSHCSISP